MDSMDSMDMEKSSSTSDISSISTTVSKKSHNLLSKQEQLNNLFLDKKLLESTIIELENLKSKQDLIVSEVDDETINNFMNILQNDLHLDVISDSFVKENIQLDSKSYDLILFDCDFDLEEVVAAPVNLEDIELEVREDINILFLKLQSYYHLRSTVFKHALNNNNDLLVDFLCGTITKDEKIILEWTILVSEGGNVVQNKLTTPDVKRQQLLKTIICKQGIYDGVSKFIE